MLRIEFRLLPIILWFILLIIQNAFKPNCEKCRKDLPKDGSAFICGYQCTCCQVCAFLDEYGLPKLQRRIGKATKKNIIPNSRLIVCLFVYLTQGLLIWLESVFKNVNFISVAGETVNGLYLVQVQFWEAKADNQKKFWYIIRGLEKLCLAKSGFG